MDRRTFIKLSGLALGGVALSKLGLAQEELPALVDLTGPVRLKDVEDIENLNSGLQRVLGVDYSALTPSDLIDLTVPEYAENGDKVALEVTVNLPPGEIKTLHAFNDVNPDPYQHILSMTPEAFASDALLETLYLVTVVRLQKDSPIRVIAETADGQLLVASRAVNVGSGGCGAPA